MTSPPVEALQSEEALLGRIRKQQLVESIEHMSPIYVEGMKRILTVSADTELISAPAYYHAAVHAPSLNAFGSAIAIIQDELGHAHIAYRLLRDLGVDTEQLIFEREPRDFKYPYAFDVPLESWVELLVANAFYDRMGYVLLSDIYKNTTFGPWKRALVKWTRKRRSTCVTANRACASSTRIRVGMKHCRRRWIGCSYSASSGVGCQTP